jgi:hypothetical protein
MHTRGSPALRYRRNIYSQNGEDGILRELLRRLPTQTKWVCEFGTLDGKLHSNTFHLIESEDYSGVFIESDAVSYEQLLATAAEHPTIVPLHRTVGVSGDDTLDAILSTTAIPTSFDVLSIDIDSYDYQVWETVKDYTPSIVVIEINSSIPPTRFDSIHGAGSSQGTGFLPMVALGVSKGYTLVCHTGNLIFVRNDLASLYSDLIVPAEECYTPAWFFS